MLSHPNGIIYYLGLTVPDHFLKCEIMQGFELSEVIDILWGNLKDIFIMCPGRAHRSPPVDPGVVAGAAVEGCAPVSFQFFNRFLQRGHLSGSGIRGTHVCPQRLQVICGISIFYHKEGYNYHPCENRILSHICDTPY